MIELIVQVSLIVVGGWFAYATARIQHSETSDKDAPLVAIVVALAWGFLIAGIVWMVA